MSIYLPKGCHTWYYDFIWRGHRYRGTTHQTRKDDAEIAESQLKLRLRRQIAGIGVFDPAATPLIQDWAEIYLTYQARHIGRIDVVERTLRVVLEFWGRKPLGKRPAPAVARAAAVKPPFHNLRLSDPIADPNWILKFQQWMDRRRVSASTRNSYLSALSGLYRVALQPEYRQRALIDTNPFRDIRREKTRGRIVALTPDQVIAWCREASYHVALAVTIGALAPKLRLQTILDLEWRQFDRDLTRLVVTKHKTAGRTGAPQVTPVSAELREVLLDAQARYPGCDYVVAYRGTPVKSVKRGAKRAVEAIGLTWGIQGVTFHTLRHSIATLMAEMGLPEAVRKDMMGHTEIRTTQQYTHLSARAQVQPHEAIAAHLPLKAVLLAKPRPKELGGKLGKTKRTPLHFRPQTNTSRTA